MSRCRYGSYHDRKGSEEVMEALSASTIGSLVRFTSLRERHDAPKKGERAQGVGSRETSIVILQGRSSRFTPGIVAVTDLLAVRFPTEYFFLLLPCYIPYLCYLCHCHCCHQLHFWLAVVHHLERLPFILRHSSAYIPSPRPIISPLRERLLAP